MTQQEAEEKSMESIVQDHEKRILELEKSYGEVKKEITVVQTSQSKIENMLYTQNMDQRELIDKQNKLIEQHNGEQKELMGTLLGHTLGIKKDNNKQRKDILIALFGGGGILFLLIESLQKWIGG